VDLLPPSVDALLAFLRASPSPFHAVDQSSRLLDAAGFAAVTPAVSWRELPPKGYAVRGGALVAWAAGDTTPHAPFRVLGAHTDSPNLRLKPRPDTGVAGWRQLAVEVYGGALVNSWLDRDLGLSGRVVTATGEAVLVAVDRPLARVAQLAIHLDRDVNERGVVLDKQQHVTPIWGLGTASEGDFVEWLAGETDLDVDDIGGWDLMFHDVNPPARLGRDDELLASGRLDNLVSCWVGIEALVRAEPVDGVAVVALFDHEEVGSDSTTGAGGPLLETLIDRLVRARGGDDDDRHRALAESVCVSADMAHAVHPNYLERHEPAHRPLPNGGPVLKVNSNQRYATNAATAHRFTSACDRAGVPWQVFVSRNNMPCGSTIGPITATRLGIDTVDVGCAQLSMHSARELCGADDPPMLARAVHALFTSG
jgi:aspartyl aminopeptidase